MAKNAAAPLANPRGMFSFAVVVFVK